MAGEIRCAPNLLDAGTRSMAYNIEITFKRNNYKKIEKQNIRPKKVCTRKNERMYIIAAEIE